MEKNELPRSEKSLTQKKKESKIYSDTSIRYISHVNNGEERKISHINGHIDRGLKIGIVESRADLDIKIDVWQEF